MFSLFHRSLHVFLPLLDVYALRGIGDPSAAHIVDGRIRGVGGSDGLDGSVVAVHAGNGEAATCVMGEPDEVALAVDGDSGDFVEGDTRVIGVVNVPVGTVEVSDTDIACGGQPLVVVGIDFDFSRW